MAEICIVCNEEITEDEDVVWNSPFHKSDGAMHKTCGEELNIESLTPREQEELGELGGDDRKLAIEKLKKQREINQQIGKRKQELREKSKGMVLTDIDLPFGRVLWVSFQFFLAGLILAIPIWLIVLIVLLITSSY